MADDKFRILEERLTRIESHLSQQAASPGAFTHPGGVVVDPAPFPTFPRPWPRWPHPIVDPGPWPPHVISDPAPWPPQTVSDPAPWGGGVVSQQATAARTLGRIGHIGGDPPPPDFSRLSASQLEATMHSITAEKARLESLESLVKRHLDRANEREGNG